MNNARLRRIEELFHSASAVPKAERAPFLAEASGGDLELANEVESLLDHHDRGLPALDSPAARLLEESDLGAGDRLGVYEIVRRVGGGGMGVVYEARDTRLGRRVALKVLLPAISDSPEFVGRFWREARIASSLDHPNLVTIFDIGEENGVRFLVSEFVEGITLRQSMARGPMPVDQAMGIVGQVADAIGAMHNVGVIHRDIKPENVMIRTDGSVRVLDFGLAKSRPIAGVPNSTLTQTGLVIGTLYYMSPEQVRGEALDPRTDLWSLGAVFFEMLTGRPPFDGATPNHIAVAILEQEPEPPAEWAGVFRKALAKSREDRYATMAQFVAALRPACEPTLPTKRIERPARVVWPLAAVLVLAALVWSGKLVYETRNGGPLTVRMGHLVSLGSAGTAAISPDGRFLAYTLEAPGKQSLRLRQIAAASEAEIEPPSGKRYNGVSFSPDAGYIYYSAYGVGNLATLYRVPVVGAAEKLMDNVDSPVTFSPDGRELAFIRSSPSSGTNALIRAGGTGEGQRALATRQAPWLFSLAGPSWSPDGAHIAVAASVEPGPGMNIAVIDVKTGKGAACGPPLSWIGRVVWPSRSELFVVAVKARSQNSQIYRIEYPRCSYSQITTDLSAYVDVTSAQHGGLLAAIREEALNSITVVEEGHSRQVTGEAGPYRGVAWADGFLLTEFASDLFRLGMDGSRTRLAGSGEALRGARACGNYLVGSSDRAGFPNIWRIGRDGRDAKPLTSGTGPDRAPECTPDGRTVVFESRRSGASRVWSVPIDGGEPVALTHVLSGAPAVSPDGSRIACSWKDGAAARWRVAILPGTGGDPVRFLDGLPVGVPFRWHPSGTALTYSDTKAGVSNIWQMDIESGVSQQITNFDGDQVFAHDWSKDGKLACVRGTANANVVSLEISR